MIDPRLATFKLAAALNNFTRAAEALGTTQPNVTRQIKELETELEVKLFRRNGRNIVLTEAAQVLLQEIGRLENAEAVLRRQVINAAARGRHYQIGATMTAGGYVLPAMLAAHLKKFPECRIDLTIANTHEITEKLKCRQLDLALVEGPFDQNFFIKELLLEDELQAVGAPSLMPAADTFPLTAYLQSGSRLILREKGSGTRYFLDTFLQANRLAAGRGQIMEVNSFDAIKQLTADGAGITIISEYVVREECAQGLLTAKPLREGKIRREMNFIYTPDCPSGFAEGFIRFCRHQLMDSSKRA